MQSSSALYSLASDFYSLVKSAGELKVPSKLLKDVQDFIVGAFCFQLDKKLNAQIQHNENRKNNYIALKKISEDWSVGWDALSDLRWENDLEPLLKWLSDIPDGSPGGKRLPEFDRTATDKMGMQGVANSIINPSINIYINHSEDKKTFYLFLYIKHNGTQFKYGEGGKSKDEIVEVIKSQIDWMAKIIDQFHDFAYEYDWYLEEKINKIKYIQMLCRKNYQGMTYLKPTGIITKDFYIKVNDFPYFKNFINPEGKHKEMNVSFSATFLPTRNDAKKILGYDDFQGLWHGRENSKIFLGHMYVMDHDNTLAAENLIQTNSRLYNIDELENIIEKLKNTTRHELQHFMQDAIKKIQNLKNQGGVPSAKIRDKKINIHGYPTKNLPEQKDEDRAMHELRDIEFYTRLSDEIIDFNKAKKHLPLALHNLFIRAWINQISKIEFRDQAKKYLQEQFQKGNWGGEGRDNWMIASDYTRRMSPAISALDYENQTFIQLKIHQPEKYKKMVKEFIKAVS